MRITKRESLPCGAPATNGLGEDCPPSFRDDTSKIVFSVTGDWWAVTLKSVSPEIPPPDQGEVRWGSTAFVSRRHVTIVFQRYRRLVRLLHLGCPIDSVIQWTFPR